MSSTEFIQLVEEYPCIYNSDLPDYARKETTEKAWQEVSEAIGLSVTECKEKWKNIRNGFVRSLKPTQNGMSKKPYYLYDAMQFVVPYINPAINIQLDKRRVPSPKIDELDQSEEEEQTVIKQEEVEIEPDPLQPRRMLRSRKLWRQSPRPDIDRTVERTLAWMQSKRMKPDDPKKMFLLSLLPDVKSLTDKQLSVFRIKVLMLLEEVKNSSGSELKELLGPKYSSTE